MQHRHPARHLLAGMLAISIGVAACGSDDDGADDLVRLWIEPEMVDCEGGAGPQRCLVISRSEGGDPELFYDWIEGFEFEPGTSYVIDVTVTEVDDPPADGSSLQYTLSEVIEP